MPEKIRLGIVGCGSFVQNFIPLFKAHPYVEWVAVTDLLKDRQTATAARHGIDRQYDSFEDMLKDDKLNAVAIFTQRQLHGPLTIAALKAGKNVYSAVPMGIKVEEIQEIVDLVGKTHLTFSMGETGYYRACSIFCRQKMRNGEMGDFVYGEAQYNHDMRHFYKSFRRSGGPDWKKVAGLPPTYYPTHSTAMILSSVESPAVYVTGFGYRDKGDDNCFGEGKNYWDNPFSNTTMILQLKNGGIARLNENRRIGWFGPPSYISCLHGTKASYEYSLSNHSYVSMPEMKAHYENLNALLNPPAVEQARGEFDFMEKYVNSYWNTEAPIQDMRRFPESFSNFVSGHDGTHKFMVDDFCKAAYTGKLSPTNAWVSARFNIPGLMAYESALKGGETMKVIDCGDSPAGWEYIDPFMD